MPAKKQADKTVVSLTPEQKKALMEEVYAFFLDEYDEEIGIIKQQRILDLFLERLAPYVYNKALDDALFWYKRRQEDLEADFDSLYKPAG